MEANTSFLADPQTSQPVPSGHRELMQVYAHGLTPKQEPFKILLTLCIADGKDCFPVDRPYIMYHLRSTFHQQFLEFFISSTLIPEEAVPYCTNNAITTEMKKISSSLQRMLKGAISSQGFLDLPHLLQTEKKVRESAKLTNQANPDSVSSDDTANHELSLKCVDTSDIKPVPSLSTTVTIQEQPHPSILLEHMRGYPETQSTAEDFLSKKRHFEQLVQDTVKLIQEYQVEERTVSPQCGELSVKINQAVNSIYSILNTCPYQCIKDLGDVIAEVTDASKILFSFTRRIYNSKWT